jgi:hypothetical protein
VDKTMSAHTKWIRLLLLALVGAGAGTSVLVASPAAMAQPRRYIVNGVQVRQAPPPLRAEVRPPRPSAGHAWIDGHWAWRGGAHVWIGGYWALPPGAGYVWEPARWANEGGNWMFFEGHWRYEGAPAPAVAYEPPPPPAQPIYAQAAPPEPIVEVQPVMPFAGAVWLPGYWHWNGGTYAWIGGRWSAGRPGYAWQPHRWERRDGRWAQVPGGWRRR